MAAQEPGGSTHDLYLVPVDGSVPPSRFVGSAPGVDDIAPMWIAGGKQLTWTQIANDGSASGGGIMVANRDGTQVRSILAQGGSTTSLVFIGGAANRGLDCSVAGAGAAVGDALLLLLALYFVRRRRV
jgi:MYXO-CTERM domain-containing protein